MDYLKQLAACEKWVEEKLQNFNPLIWTEKKAAYTRRKAFAELAIYAYVHVSHKQTPHGKLLEDFICDIANNVDFHNLLLRNPRHLLLFSAPIAFAHSVGRASEKTIECMDKALNSPQAFAIERSAHRMMDLWQFLTVVDRCPDWLNPNQILAQSCLSNMLSPMDFTLSEAYAFTHNILFLKNFGVADHRFSGKNYDLDHSAVSLMIARYFYEDNSDIILELLMVLGMLGQINKRDCKFIFDWLLDRNDQQDFIKGPKFDADKDLAYSGLDQEWVSNYHTTLVAMSTFILCDENGWLECEAIAPCLPEDETVLRNWGYIINLINNYELPAAVSELESVDKTTNFSQHAYEKTSCYFEHISNPNTGMIGYWTDELKAAEEKYGDHKFEQELQKTSSLMREILNDLAA